MPEDVWSEQDTTPGAIEEALRKLLYQRHSEDEAYVPARVLNLVVVMDREWRGEIANRLEGVGRYQGSRTILCSVEPGRDRIDAHVSVAYEANPAPGTLAVVRETVEVRIGPKHLDALGTIVDPIRVVGLITMVWAPHGHQQAVNSLLKLCDVVLLDSVEEPDVTSALTRVDELAQRAYVVDLAWLRSTPWRERIAATFDPPQYRGALGNVAGVTVRHREDSQASALLLCGWLSSRLGWKPGRLSSARGAWTGHARARRQEVKMRLEPVNMNPPGLDGVTIELASGAAVSLDRGPGGLRSVRRARDGSEQAWTVLGASRGEAGILGEGVRQALLRDPIYRPALSCARVMAT
jgi:glucose-6-phosphate dehydrogenase assembly protein OpcA